jgi:hypothetical protein
VVGGAHRENRKVGASIGSIKDNLIRQDKEVFGDILYSMTANRFVECLGAEETNRGLRNVVPFDVNGMLSAMAIQDMPL